jgi:hypothetical protein
VKKLPVIGLLVAAIAAVMAFARKKRGGEEPEPTDTGT